MSSMARPSREEQQLRQIIRDIPGNDECADCTTPGPAWASYSIGVFLCTRCASIHRKVGTHISRVKSISLDSWTPEQVATMQAVGNTISNYNLNPLREWPLRDDDYGMEQFIRDKYERRKFTTQRETGSFRPIKSALKGSTAVTETPAFSATANRYAKEMTTLRDMGFTNRAQLVEVLTQTNGDLVEATERLLTLGNSTTTSGTGPPGKPKRPRVRFTADTIGGEDTPVAASTNPFDLWSNTQANSQQPVSANPNPFSSIPPSMYHNAVFTGMQTGQAQAVSQVAPLRAQLTGGQPLRPQTPSAKLQQPMAYAATPQQYTGPQPLERQQTGPQLGRSQGPNETRIDQQPAGPSGSLNAFRPGAFDTMQEQLSRMEQTLRPQHTSGPPSRSNTPSMSFAGTEMQNTVGPQGSMYQYQQQQQQQQQQYSQPFLRPQQTGPPVTALSTGNMQQTGANQSGAGALQPMGTGGPFISTAHMPNINNAPFTGVQPQHTGGGLPQQMHPQALTAGQEGRTASPFIAKADVGRPNNHFMPQGFGGGQTSQAGNTYGANSGAAGAPVDGLPTQFTGHSESIAAQHTGFSGYANAAPSNHQQLGHMQAQSTHPASQYQPNNFRPPQSTLQGGGNAGLNPMQPLRPFDKSSIMSLYRQPTGLQRSDSPLQPPHAIGQGPYASQAPQQQPSQHPHMGQSHASPYTTPQYASQQQLNPQQYGQFGQQSMAPAQYSQGPPNSGMYSAGPYGQY